MKIFLIGFMGAGKTSYGEKLARKLKFDFLDLDKQIEEKTGKSIDSWFSEEGEELFRIKESEILRATEGLDNVVIATGGGAPCFYENMDWMNANGTTVYLNLLEHKLADRLLKAKKERPLVAGMDKEELKEFIHEKLTERSLYYAKAKISVEPSMMQARDLGEMLAN